MAASKVTGWTGCRHAVADTADPRACPPDGTIVVQEWMYYVVCNVDWFSHVHAGQSQYTYVDIAHALVVQPCF